MNQDVLRLEVTVDDSLRVQVGQRPRDLAPEVGDRALTKRGILFDILSEVLAIAVLEQSGCLSIAARG